MIKDLQCSILASICWPQSVTSHTVICGEMEHTVGIIAELGSRGAQIRRLGFVDAFGITRC